MALTDIVEKGFREIKNFLFTPREKQGMLKYLLEDKEIQGYLSRAEGGQRQQLYQRLESHLDTAVNKYGGFLDSWYLKAAKIGGIASLISDIYQMFISKVPLTGAQYVPIVNLMVIAKTLAEAPPMFYYILKSGDYVAALKWLGMKPVEIALPILGPLLGMDWTRKIISQRILYEAKSSFLKDLGAIVEKPYERIDRHAEQVTGTPIRAYSTA